MSITLPKLVVISFIEVWDGQALDAMFAGNGRFDLLAPLFLKHDGLMT